MGPLGGGVRVGFEGGQMPLARRLPKRGFHNIFAKPLEAVNVSTLDAKFQDGETVTAQALLEKGILSKCQYGREDPGQRRHHQVADRPGFRLLRLCQGKNRSLRVVRWRWSDMIKTIREAWQIPELRKKILFTIFALAHLPPGLRCSGALYQTARVWRPSCRPRAAPSWGLMNAMSGSAFSMATLFALSIQPYINSSIIIQLLTVAIPALERLAKEGGEEGRKKIASITRYTTVAIGLIQGFGYFSLINAKRSGGYPRPARHLGGCGHHPVLHCRLRLPHVAGRADHRVRGGHGISILLFAGIVSRFPQMLGDMITGIQYYRNPLTEEQLEAMSETDIAAYNNLMLAPWMIAVVVIGMLALVVLIVFIYNSERRLPVQYAKRVVGRKMYGGQSTHIPMKVNMGGVMPIIFAQSIAMIPATIGAFAGWTTTSGGFGGTLMMLFDTANPFYSVLYFLLIVGFSYFYATMQFNPIEVANNLKKNGGFIPGFRPGKPTADFITKVLNKITMFGALYLSIVAIAPIITGNLFGYSSLAIGGTSVIIVVGVALETVKQMEAQMLMRHYKGFLE